jgi:hypothetical protein
MIKPQAANQLDSPRTGNRASPPAFVLCYGKFDGDHATIDRIAWHNCRLYADRRNDPHQQRRGSCTARDLPNASVESVVD